MLKTGIYEIVTEKDYCSESTKISWIPYVLNVVFTYILVKPLGLINLRNFKTVRGSLNQQGLTIFNTCKIVCVLFMFLKMYQLFIVSSYGFGNFHDIGDEAQRSFLYGGNPLLYILNYAGRIINISIFPFFLTYLFFQWQKGCLRLDVYFKYFLLYAFNTISVGLVAGSRASMLYGFLDILFFLLVFWCWMPLKVKKYLVFGSITVLSIFLVVFLLISTQRFDNVPPIFNFLSYLGQSYLNLGFEFWNNLRAHTLGAITMGPIFGVELPDYFETTGVHDDWFRTAYGAFFEDFGPVIPVFIALFLSKIFRMFIKNGKNFGIEKIIAVLFYFQLCYQIPFGIAFDFFYIFSLFVIVIVPNYLKSYIHIRR